MLESLEKLLILQDRDRRLLRLRVEIADVEPQRRLVQQRKTGAEQEHESTRHHVLRLETERKKLELEVSSHNEQIAKYSAQQWQTRKNEEYRALSHEIETCREAIRKLEDQQLALMEQIEAGERHLAETTEVLRKAREDSQVQLEQLATTDTRLALQLAEAESSRAEFAKTVEPGLLLRYERLLKSKGGNIVVGIDRGVCGGCHMKIARQDVLNTQASRDITQCPNCGRILYYTRDMDVKPVE